MSDLTPVPSRLQRYVDYIRNTGQKPLPTAAFDDDWEPIGPMIRKEMTALGLIYETGAHSALPQPEGIRLRPDLEKTDV